ncbi:chorismate mutase [Candidatus Poriferisodalis sp.]|uniref:chorismate mutase n=1 Tax=Candidatus Poriferisodalis sp. TaxID=3101277 RepID=UPI003B02B613
MTDDELAAHRSSIDEVDAALVRLLAERFRITHDIGVYKANNDLPPVDLVRQHQQVDGLRQIALAEGLDPDFCERFLHFVMDEVIRNHRRIAEAASEFMIEQETL